MAENEKDIDALKKELEQLMREFGGLQKQSDENIEKIESFLPKKETPKVEVKKEITPTPIKKEIQKTEKEIEKPAIIPKPKTEKPAEKKVQSKSDFDSEMERLFYPNRAEEKEKTSEPKIEAPKPISETPKVEKPVIKKPKTPAKPIAKQEPQIKVKEVIKETPKTTPEIKKPEPVKPASQQMSSMEKLRAQMEANDKKEATDKLKKEVKPVAKVTEVKKPISAKTPAVTEKTKPVTLKTKEVKASKAIPSKKAETKTQPKVKAKKKGSLGFYLKVFLWSLFIYLAVVIGYLYFTKNQYFLYFVDKTFGTTLAVNSDKIDKIDTAETPVLNTETEITNTIIDDSISTTEADLMEEVELP